MMNFLNRLERRFGRYAIPNLMLYIILLNAAGMVLSIVYPQSVWYLSWSMSRILKGEVWRLVSFIMVPYSSNPVNFLIYGFLYYSISQTLERSWGAFRMNMYIITGLLGTILAGVVVYALFRVDTYMSISYLSNSLFLALAATYPDVQFLLFFIIPIKAKWMALLSVVMYLYDLMQIVNAYGWMPYGIATLIVILFSLVNFIIYFLGTRDFQRINPREVQRRAEFRKKMGQREQSGRPLHKCTVCGRTDRDFPELEFRYCSKCDGAYEYCSEHLYTHKHIIANSYERQ